MTFPLSPLPINRCTLFAKNTMKYNPFEFKLYSNPLCTSCPSDSLRERARSERLRNLGERLRWVRGPGVRRSHILPYPSLIHLHSCYSAPYPTPIHSHHHPSCSTVATSPHFQRKDDPQSLRSSSRRTSTDFCSWKLCTVAAVPLVKAPTPFP